MIVPAHLQDLKEGDLPEAQRVAVLDQIAIFRENAARREREKKISQEDRERYMNMPSSHVEYGYGTRALPKETSKLKGREERERERDGGRDGGRDRARDPQGYSDPVAFVRAETAEGKGESERTDEEDEAVRQQQRERERAQALRDVSEWDLTAAVLTAFTNTFSASTASRAASDSASRMPCARTLCSSSVPSRRRVHGVRWSTSSSTGTTLSSRRAARSCSTAIGENQPDL